MNVKIFLFSSLMVLNSYHCQKKSSYRAAVVEVHPESNVANQFVNIIYSPDVKNVDIIVFPEAILAHEHKPILLPNSTVFCDDPNAHSTFRDISCAARMAKMYVVIDVYTKVYCSLDDQSFCVHKEDNTNTYNIAFVFDRTGTMIAKYRKFHLFSESVQRPEKPDIITFQTDFNVTFGVCICFDLLFDSPPVKLVDSGVRNFVYPTMWPMELPFMTAAQYQQSWAYANNVNLLAANANANVGSFTHYSGSGIYTGRLAALDIFVTKIASTKVLIANVPIDSPSLSIDNDVEEFELAKAEIKFAKDTTTMEKLPSRFEMNENSNGTYDRQVIQENLTMYTIDFLDFSQRLSYNETICSGDLCCHYDIDVDDNGSQDGKPSYSYAVTVLNGYRGYIPVPNLFTHQSVCGLIACGEMNNRNSCGKRFASDVHHRYTFNKLSFTMTSATSRAKNIMPNTLSNDLYPLNGKEFDLKTSKLSDAQKYATTLTLKVPESDLLTFAIFARDYEMDKMMKESSENEVHYQVVLIP